MPELLSTRRYSEASRIGQFWYWWTSELAEMLPSTIRRNVLTGQSMLLTIKNRQLILSKVTGKAAEIVDRIPMGEIDDDVQSKTKYAENRYDVVLCLSSDHMFSRTLELPLAAEENLREVLSFEMDRHTPFSADQVYYDFQIIKRDKDNGKLSVTLIVVLKEKLDRLIKYIENMGFLVLKVTSYKNTVEDRLPVNLLHERKGQKRPQGISLFNKLLLALVLILCGIAAGLPIWHKQQAVDVLKPRLAAISQDAKGAVALREELDKKVAESRFLIEKKQTSVFLLEIINELTTLLPDDTWLVHMDIDGDEVHVRGESPAAATLIPLVESSPLFYNTRFRSPVTQNRRTNAERFHLSVEVMREGDKQ